VCLLGWGVAGFTPKLLVLGKFGLVLLYSLRGAAKDK